MDLLTLAGGGEEIATIAVVGGLTIAVLGMILGAVRGISQTKQREQTKREIAAYIAEGSMTPEQGERLMAAGKGKDASCC